MSRIDATFKMDSVAKILKKRGLDSGGKVQRFVDSEIIRRIEPYCPKLSGTMSRSVKNASVPGTGKVVVDTPYAYLRNKVAKGPPTDYGQLRGPQYFERMKSDHRRDILEKAGRLAGVEVEN